MKNNDLINQLQDLKDSLSPDKNWAASQKADMLGKLGNIAQTAPIPAGLAASQLPTAAIIGTVLAAVAAGVIFYSATQSKTQPETTLPASEQAQESPEPEEASPSAEPALDFKLKEETPNEEEKPPVEFNDKEDSNGKEPIKNPAKSKVKGVSDDQGLHIGIEYEQPSKINPKDLK